jgi:hypothetical protein
MSALWSEPGIFCSIIALPVMTQKRHSPVVLLDYALNPVTIEAPNEIAATALGLSIGKAGNVRTQTLRAFSQAEMGPILSKVT